VRPFFTILCMGALLAGCSKIPLKEPLTKDSLYEAIERGDSMKVRRCIEAGIKLNEPRIPGGQSPLTITTLLLNVEIVQMLLDAGADPSLALARSPEGQTGVILGKWPSPLVGAQMLLMASQMAGKDLRFRHSMKAELEMTKRSVDVLQDPQFDDKMTAIIRMMEKHMTLQAHPPAPK